MERMICRKCKKEIPEESKYCNLCGSGQSVPVRAPKKRGNGQGTVYKRENGKWQAEVRIYKDGRNYRATKGGFDKKKDALEYIAQLRSETDYKVVTLNDLYTKDWSKSAAMRLSKSKRLAYEIAFNKFTDIKYWDIRNIKIHHLQEMVDGVGTSYDTKKDLKALLSHLYKRAVAQQDISNNLALYIELPRTPESKQEPFSEDELKLFWKDYGEGNKFSGYILMMVYSGMMPGELLNAQKDMIDWKNQVIEGCGLKTKKRKTTPIVVADFMVPVLMDLCSINDSNKLLPMGKNQFYDEYKATLERLGCRQLPPYSCRHTTATALALGNIAPSVIQEVMRHSKITTTQKYIHIGSQPMIDAVNTLMKSK